MGYATCLNYLPSWQWSVIRDDNDQEHYLGRRCHQEGLLNTGPICLLFLSEPGREGADRDGVQLAQGADPPACTGTGSYIRVQTDPLTLAGYSPCPCSHRSEPWIGKQRMLMFGLKMEKTICILEQVGSKQLENWPSLSMFFLILSNGSTLILTTKNPWPSIFQLSTANFT